MIGIIVVGHIHFSSGLRSSVEAIVGEQKKIKFIDFLPSTSAEQLQVSMEEAIVECHQGQGVLIMTDILGGTPCNRAMALLTDTKQSNIRVVTGSNLPMIANACLERDNCTLDELVQFVLDIGHQSVCSVTSLENEDMNYNITDDGL